MDFFVKIIFFWQLAQWWLDKVYLEPRYPLPINVNPNILFPKQNFNTVDDQLTFATHCIHGVIEYKKIIDSQSLPVEKQGNNFLCMDQYYKIIGSCRVPRKFKDEIKMPQPLMQASNYVTVIYKNRVSG